MRTGRTKGGDCWTAAENVGDKQRASGQSRKPMSFLSCFVLVHTRMIPRQKDIFAPVGDWTISEEPHALTRGGASLR